MIFQADINKDSDFGFLLEETFTWLRLSHSFHVTM